ncbi:MAG TPA: restriction endonuclease [Bacteroidetes bacterium]|nr:restriction endonuclease [Bacteroidota bacterium]HRK04730.1 HNH endonuclease [Chlorobiota bacterium]
MRIFVGVTDIAWFRHLAGQEPPVSEVNFWRPGGGAFAALQPGCPFLFKLKAPINKIAGVGFFHSFTRLPLRVAWETFSIRNGRGSYDQLLHVIQSYRHGSVSATTEIGCILLESPVFFDEYDWFDVPADFQQNVVVGKSYDSSTPQGNKLWQHVSGLLEADRGKAFTSPSQVVPSVFGKEYLRKSRPGQAGFKVGLLDAYGRRCAITGENIVPVLEAAHIQPVHENGTNELSNGLLLRSDMHKLFDDGLIGITPDRTIRVSNQIRDLYVNGKVYYSWDGKPLTVLPKDELLLPDSDRLDWHLSHVFIP